MSEQNISKETIEKACLIAARVVKEFGDTYLPIFQRMHQELIKKEEEEKLKTLAMQTAIEYASRK
jgi:hypothetical protein